MAKAGALLALGLASLPQQGCRPADDVPGGCCGYAVHVYFPASACAVLDAGNAIVGDGGPAGSGCAASDLCQVACGSRASRTGCTLALQNDIECNVPGVCCGPGEGLQCYPGCVDIRTASEAQDLADRIRTYVQTRWPQTVTADLPGYTCVCKVN
jgi:hypothetical protein